MFNTKTYLDNIAVTPKDMWEEIKQATINSMWEDTTQIYKVKEQKALPFVDEYTECEAWLSTVSDDLINTSKVYSDFVRLVFKDINHKQNYKGQYYKISLDDEHEEYYICYDRLNKLTQTADCRCVRCNNVLTWLDEYGNVVEMPCYLGTDISSTNNLISKSGITPNVRMIVLVQANEFTKNIVKNQRFMFQNSTAFKVDEVNNYMQEQGTDGEVTCVKIYVSYSAILPIDNIELNICDYYNTEYTLDIDQDNIKQINGFIGKLSATIKNKDNTVDLPVIWETSNKKVVKINENGEYNIVGKDGDTAIITCTMANNPNVSNDISVEVINSVPLEPKIIRIIPNTIKEIMQGDSVDINVGVYQDSVLQSDIVTCVASGAKTSCYELSNVDNVYTIKNIKLSSKPLTLTFSSTDCEDLIIDIKLGGLV